MGLFSKHDNDAQPEDDSLELPTRDDFHQPLVEETRTRPAGRYSFDDAIGLIRDLPEAPSDELMAVICKTLESAHIRLDDVLQDARQKEQRVRREHQGIEQDIQSLQKQIDKKQSELSELAHTLEELIRIKERFEHARPQQAPSPAPTASPASPTTSPFASEESDTPTAEEEPATPISAGRRGRGPGAR
ncbi:DUF4200 domain-containing protein [Marinimicrobium agarilyticum]|uniref:DUF4200 domain-containing protein n=1 Tax=Marinimicrobium agarilyticum TaxID=306546 RepID=UPI000415A980|nr:DUF4200 domain-containing protein [Marinimicrobium agarilyticum]